MDPKYFINAIALKRKEMLFAFTLWALISDITIGAEYISRAVFKGQKVNSST